MIALLTLLLFVVAFLGLHFGLGLAAWSAVVIAAVVALCGHLFIIAVIVSVAR